MSDPVTINEAAIHEILDDPNGRLGRFLERQADRVVDLAKKNLSTNYPPAGIPGGYPARRTGDLMDSVHRSLTLNGPDGIFIDIVADSVHEGHSYSVELRNREYVFVTEEDLESLNEG